MAAFQEGGQMGWRCVWLSLRHHVVIAPGPLQPFDCFSQVLVITLITPNLDAFTKWNVAVLARYCEIHRHKLWIARSAR